MFQIDPGIFTSFSAQSELESHEIIRDAKGLHTTCISFVVKISSFMNPVETRSRTVQSKEKERLLSQPILIVNVYDMNKKKRERSIDCPRINANTWDIMCMKKNPTDQPNADIAPPIRGRS